MTSVAPGAPPAVWADQDPGSGRVTIRQLLSRMGTLCWVELRKLRHDRTELYTRAIQPALWLIIFGETFNRIHAIRTPHGISIGQAITMPLFFSSNALYPTALMPGWLQAISRVNPLSYEVDGWHCSSGYQPTWRWTYRADRVCGRGHRRRLGPAPPASQVAR